MPLPGVKAKNLNDLVNQAVQDSEKIVTDRIELPGIKQLHTKSKEEIAAVLTNFLLSRSNVKELKFVIGSHIEVTYDANPMNQVR
jgi:hypothetical protein